MIPTALARRFAAWRTRAALAALWWRHSYPFNWAHKPLCTRFESNIIRVGQVHLCRSCTLLYAGAAATLLVLLAVDVSAAAFRWWFYALFTAVVPLSYPPLYEHFPRPAKDLLRCATGAVMVLLGAQLIRGNVALGLVNIAVFAAAYRLSLGEYRKWKRRACSGCPELGRDRICSGFRRQADRIRAYETAADHYLGHDHGHHTSLFVKLNSQAKASMHRRQHVRDQSQLRQAVLNRSVGCAAFVNVVRSLSMLLEIG